MSTRQHADTAQDLVRRAYLADSPPGPFDVEAGLREVIGRRDDPRWPNRYETHLIAAHSGDRRALQVLIAELTPVVWHVARGNGLDRAAAEAVVQAVWLSLLRHLNRLTDSRALVAWLITTARREASHARRGTASLPETEFPQDERDRQLWAAFHRLPKRCQELLRLTVLSRRGHGAGIAHAPQRMPLCLAMLRSFYDEESS